MGVTFTLRRFQPGNDLLDANPLTDIVIEAGTNGVSPDAQLESLFGPSVVSGAVIFSDDPSDPHSASAETESYRLIAGSRTPNTVTIKVVDQYGDPLRNVDVTLNSDLDDIDRATDSTDDTNETIDQVLYPEQVDITVQARENADGDRIADGNPNAGQPNAGETTAIDPTTRYINLIAPASVPDTSGPTAGDATTRTTRTLALRVSSTDETAVAPVAEDDVIGTYKTRRDGTYRIGYVYTASTEAQTEMITPQSARVEEVAILKAADGTLSENTEAVEFDANGMITPGSGTRLVRNAELGSAVSVYWTDIGTSEQSDAPDAVGGDPEAVAVYVTDVGRRTIVANEAVTGDDDEPKAYFYDEDDVFIIESIGASFEMFEEALALTMKDNGCRVNEVEWENYTYWRDPDRFGARPGRVDRTIWRINLS